MKIYAKHDHHCGPGDYFPRWLKRFIGKYILNNEVCAAHDFFNALQEEPQVWQDTQFLNLSLYYAKNWFNVFAAYSTYYLIFKPFGPFFYHLEKIRKFYIRKETPKALTD